MKKHLLTVLFLFASILMMSSQTISLNGEWMLDYWEQGRIPVMTPEAFSQTAHFTISATVPGNVELELAKAGIIQEPELGSNVNLLRPFEGYQWRYSRSFDTPEYGSEDQIILNFEGIDCFAEIYVNGTRIGNADNMLISHCYDITDAINPKQGQKNSVEVFIKSSVVEGRKEIPPVFSNNWHRPESVYVRRAGHTYGWDIMPRLVSAGLWRSVSLDVVPPVHIRDAHWMTAKLNPEDMSATVYCDYTVSLPVKYQSGAVKAKVSLSKDGKIVYEHTRDVTLHSFREKIYLTGIEYWWPRGYGEPSLYDATVTLLDAGTQAVLDSDTRKIGIRTIQLDMTSVNHRNNPGRFCFIVNEEPIFVHGSNWTPMDAFHSRDPQHLKKTFSLAVDLNCNMLRCWGGNVYEDDEFYDLCDLNGIMIWQDFSMGCSFYPQTPDFQKQIGEEVKTVVTRLRSHPCIALWAGNNEDDCMIADDNFSFYKPDPNKDVVTRQTIPAILFETDPTRAYLPSSPYWSEQLCNEFYSAEGLPEDHLWGPRGYYKDAFYTENNCLFVSEIGYHGMPCRESLERMFPKESVYPWIDSTSFHWNNDWQTKSVNELYRDGYDPSRNDLMINQVFHLFGEKTADLDRFIFASQAVQAEAMKFFIERFRSQKFDPRTGILWWNIRDGWPIISDAVVDWYFNKKLAYHFIKNVQQDICVMISDDKDGSHPITVVNDTRITASGKVTVRDVGSGKTVFKGEYNVEANGKSVIAVLPPESGQGIWVITYSSPGKKEMKNHYLYGKAPFNLDTYKRLLEQTDIYGQALLI